MNVDIALTKPQRDFCFSNSKYPAIVGGLGSGKSRGGTFRAVAKLLDNVGCNIGYYMPVYDLLRLRAMPGVEDDLTMMGMAFETNKSEYTIKVFGYGSIIFRSYDKPERIVAYEVAHSIVDELDILSKEKAELVWRKISERNRQKCNEPNSIGVVTTPDQGINGFIYDKWVKKQQEGYQLIKAPTASNPFLPKDYIEQIRANYDEKLADLYLLGEFVSLTDSKVYHFFDRSTHHTDRELLDTDKYIYVGIDFNIGGCCATVSIIEGNSEIQVDEFVSHDTYDFCNNLTQYEGHHITVYPDASGNSRSTNATESDIAIIEGEGHAVEYDLKNPPVRNRINAINRLLSHKRFLINTDKCPETTHALESQGYTDKGEPEKFSEHPSVDDWTDSAGYKTNQLFPISHIRTPRNAGFYR